MDETREMGADTGKTIGDPGLDWSGGDDCMRCESGGAGAGGGETFGDPGPDEEVVGAAGGAAAGDDDDVVTEEEYEQLVSRRVFDRGGDAVFQLTNVKEVPPEKDMPGGPQATFVVVKAPPGATTPKGGFRPVVILFPKRYAPGHALKENEETRLRIAKQEKATLVKAVGGKAGADGRLNLDGELKAAAGRGAKVLVTVVHEKDRSGVERERFRNYRPIAG